MITDCKLKIAAERLDEKITVTIKYRLKTDDDGSEDRKLPGQLSTFQTMRKHSHCSSAFSTSFAMSRWLCSARHEAHIFWIFGGR